jgi:hypothetical protein
VEAPPGLGKSTLHEHVADLAREQDFLVLSAAGRELERGLGWGVARSLFEPWLLARPALERDELLGGPAAAARTLFETHADAAGRSPSDVSFAILHGLHWLAVRLAERSPLLIAVDDAQWADEPSLRFLAYLHGRLRDQPVGLLVAARAGEPGAGGLLTQLAGNPAATVCDLAPLGPEAVATLIRARVPEAGDDFCRRCSELTAGNPLSSCVKPPETRLTLAILLVSLSASPSSSRSIDVGGMKTLPAIRSPPLRPWTRTSDGLNVSL